MTHLENGKLMVKLDPVTGGFVSIMDKRIGREYVFASGRTRLFRLMLSGSGRLSNRVDSTEPSIAVDGDTATVRFRPDGVVAIATLRLDGDSVDCSLRVTNTGTRGIEEVMFPCVRELGPIQGAAIVRPSREQRRIGDPFGKDLGGDHRTLDNAGQRCVGHYPWDMASAWCDYGDANGGVCIEGRQTDFASMDFHVVKTVDKLKDSVRRALELAVSHTRRIEPGETWESPLVRIRAHEGDWHFAADGHRAWLEQWIGKPERPTRFAEAIGWHFFRMNRRDGSERWTYADLPDMAEAALKAGCRYVMVSGWQADGSSLCCAPNEEWGGADVLREGLRRVRERGVEVIPLFNGDLPVVELPEEAPSARAWAANAGPIGADMGRWPKAGSDVPSSTGVLSCHEPIARDGHRDYFLEAAERIVDECDFGNIRLERVPERVFADEDDGAPSHGATAHGLGELFFAAHRVVRRANADGVMVSEWLSDFAAQWCDGSVVDMHMQPFPEPVLYSLPWAFASQEIDALEYGEANRAFAYKLQMDIKVDGGEASIAEHENFAAHINRLAQLRRRVADYYVHGDFRDEEGVRMDGGDNVIAKVFHHRAVRKVAIVVAECAGHKGEARLRIDWLPASGTVLVDGSKGDAGVMEYTPEVRLRLEPYEVGVFCLDL